MTLAFIGIALTSIGQKKWYATDTTVKFPTRAVVFSGMGSIDDITTFTGSIGAIYKVKGIVSVQPRIGFTFGKNTNTFDFAVAPTLSVYQFGKVATYVGIEFAKKNGNNYVESSPELGALLLFNTKAFGLLRLNYPLHYNNVNNTHAIPLNVGIGINL